VEKVNEKVLDGQSFRDAYHDVASDVKSGVFRRPGGVSYTHEGSIGNLCLDAIQNNMKKVVEPFSFSKIDTMYKKLLEE
jgi:argininosuccinate lyase